MKEVKSNVDNLAKDIFLFGRKKSDHVLYTMLSVTTNYSPVMEILLGVSAILMWPGPALNYSAWIIQFHTTYYSFISNIQYLTYATVRKGIKHGKMLF